MGERNLRVSNKRNGRNSWKFASPRGVLIPLFGPTFAWIHIHGALFPALSTGRYIFEKEKGERKRGREGKRVEMPPLEGASTAVDIVLRRLLLRFHLTPHPVGSSRLSGKYLSVIRAGRMELKTVAFRDIATFVGLRWGTRRTVRTMRTWRCELIEHTENMLSQVEW